MKQMSTRNQFSVGIVGTIVVVAVVLVSMNLNKLPFIRPMSTYYADFSDANGLISGDNVRVEGVTVGTVKSVKVEGDHVRVAFTVKQSLKLGGNSAASIEIATILGNLFMQVESAGPGTLRPGSTIPASRTTTPYTLVGALQQFTSFAQNTDVPALQKSLDTLANAISGIKPTDARTALSGIASISQTLASKQAQVSQVLTAANSITQTLNANSSALVQVLVEGDGFLHLIEQRSSTIKQLLADTASLGSQLSALISRNGAQLSGLLSNLNQVTAVLANDQKQLQAAVVNLGQFSVNITNATGAGPWLDIFLPTSVIANNVLNGCGPTPNTSTGPCS